MPSTRKHRHKKTYYNDIGLRLGEKLLGLKHLHYGFFAEGTSFDLAGLQKAQDDYVDKVLSFVPEEVRTVLDVGCGMGSMAKELLSRGKELTCIAPDPYLIGRTNEATDSKVSTIEDLYENVDSLEPESFDLVLMAESCQYVNVAEGWKQSYRYLKSEGYLLVSDFFKKRDEVLAHISKSGHVLNKYIEAGEAQGFRLLQNEDITEDVAPTMDIYQELLSEKAFPVAEAAAEFLERKYPKVYKLVKWKYGEKISRLRKKYKNQGSDPFKEHKTYRILLFQKLPSQ